MDPDKQLVLILKQADHLPASEYFQLTQGWTKANKTSVQSVICSKSKFSSVSEAKKWVSDHGFKTDKVDETDTSYRFRQFPPEECTSGSFRTISLTDGVSAVICKKKNKDMEETLVTPEQIAALKEFYKGQEQHIVAAKFSDGSEGFVRFLSVEKKEVNEAEASIVHLVSTPRIDYVKDVMNPFGVNTDALRKNKAVFYNHRWSGSQDLPIGKSLWQKSQRSGVLAKTQYAVSEYPFAADVFRLVVNDYLNSYSIGWMPQTWEFVLISDLLKITEGKFDIPNIADYKPDDKVMLHQAWGMHEYSQVGVPMNQDAVKNIGIALEKGLVQSDFGKDVFGSIAGRMKIVATLPQSQEPEGDVKGAIGYHDYGNCEEGMAWNGRSEVAAASTSDLKKMCAWYDESAPDAKGSYKLPHHRQGDKKAVWRGVAAAMGALLGSRGGVQIPKDDRKAVYNHLAHHYRDFEKTAPEFKEYTEAELKEMFKEFQEEEDNRPAQLNVEETRKALGIDALENEVKGLRETLAEVKAWIDAPVDFSELKVGNAETTTPDTREMSSEKPVLVEFDASDIIQKGIARGISRAKGKVD